MRDVSFFFNPASIAIIGASPTRGKISNSIMNNMAGSGYRGRVHLVNPKYEAIGKEACYKSVADIREEVDLAVVCVPAAGVMGAMDGIVKKRVRGVILVTAGFGETGGPGTANEERLRAVSLETGIRIMGPNCLGIFDTVSKLDTFFILRERIKRPGPGGLSVLSQSGSFAGTIMDTLADEGLGVARIVNYGNRVDVGESDCLEFLATDDATKVVGIYMESVDDGRRFVEAAKRCAGRKPVFAIKIGRHEAGINAARSHTGAIAGRYEIYRAAFRKAGVVEVTGYREFLDASRVLTKVRPAGGKRVLVVTDGGGMGASVADACGDMGLDVPPLSEEVREALSGRLPPFCSIGNPVDLTGSATDGHYVSVLDAAMDGYDAVIVMALWGPPGLTDSLITMLAEAAAKLKKPLIMCNPGGEYTREKNKLFERAGLPVFSSPEAAARAAAVLLSKRRRG